MVPGLPRIGFELASSGQGSPDQDLARSAVAPCGRGFKTRNSQLG